MVAEGMVAAAAAAAATEVADMVGVGMVAAVAGVAVDMVIGEETMAAAATEGRHRAAAIDMAEAAMGATDAAAAAAEDTAAAAMKVHYDQVGAASQCYILLICSASVCMLGCAWFRCRWGADACHA